MVDMLYIGITIVFFALTWGLMKMCEGLGEHKSGEQQ